MTEQDWLACAEPVPMLEWLSENVNDRAWRLYLCGGCRHITHQFYRSWSMTAVETAEQFVDGKATPKDLKRADYGAEAAWFGYDLDYEHFSHTEASRLEVVPRLVEMGALPESVLSGGPWQVDEATRRRLVAAAALACYCADPRPSKSTQWIGFVLQVDWPARWLVDCIFGNPFRPSAIDPAWLTWRDGTVVNLAQGAYDERALPSGELNPMRLAVLADALEEAGCTNAEIVGHLRSPGPHVRGCWVVDRLLGKS